MKDNMNIKDRAAPCGLHCGKCFAFKDGEIHKLSRKFPCPKTGLDENFYQRHVAINHRMKEIGVEAYYEEIEDKPRY